MHLCMQDDQISQKFIGLTPADMDRLPHLLNTEKKVFISKQPSPSARITPTPSLLCLQGLIVSFVLIHSPSSLNYSDFYGFCQTIRSWPKNVLQCGGRKCLIIIKRTRCTMTRFRVAIGRLSLSSSWKSWVGIQKPVVTYDSRKSSVTSSARLPNYFKINL
jgi:hypothetical protein